MAGNLAETMPQAEIVVSDSLMVRAEEVAASIGKENVRAVQLDLSEFQRLTELLAGFDLAVGLAPGKLGYQSMRACIEAGVDMVDLSYMPEDPLTLHQKAVEADVTVVPDCGVAPGLSNILVGKAAGMLDLVESVHIFVGGLPERPVPPLGYKVTWCVEDLIEEYVRKALIVEGGRVVEVDALDGLEMIDIPRIGVLEAFYTDGVRTLHHTIRGVRSMWEKTLRYPGHADKIRLLRELGFFDEDPVVLERGINITPRELTGKVFENKLSMFEVKDLVVMKVEVGGVQDNRETIYTYNLLDRFDEEKRMTAMARTTAYTASIVVELLARGVIEEKGVVPPERLGMSGVVDDILNSLEAKGIEIEEFKTQRRR